MSSIYFVVEPEQIVAYDLAHSIRAYDPQAEVRIFARVEDAVEVLAVTRPRAMFVHDEPGHFLQSAGGRKVIEAGIPLAFSGPMGIPHTDGAPVLASPFSERTVAEVLRRLLDFRTGRPV